MTYTFPCIKKAFAEGRLKYHLVYLEDDTEDLEVIKQACDQVVQMSIDLNAEQDYTQIKAQSEKGQFIVKLYVEPIVIF